MPLPVAFYARPVEEVAPDLLGCRLVVGGVVARIVETEAYHQREGASHGYREPPRAPAPTARTRVLFGPPGRGYVYRSHGLHACLNAVCETDGVAAGVLLRAVEPLEGVDLVRSRRPGRRDAELTSGPGRLTLALGISLDDDGVDLATGRIRIVTAAHDDRPVEPVSGPRIGISRAKDLPWRWVDASSPDVSSTLPPGMARRPSRRR
ncbi:MAG: DNA-3-methyladenine glycosylase [Solirubrobacteraceae bacterium]|nr:DNA-3-methyladenine glycosylase [Solirubrobacteraceae bacterium]